MKIDNDFHPNLLQKTLTDTLSGPVNKPLPTVIISNEKR